MNKSLFTVIVAGVAASLSAGTTTTTATPAAGATKAASCSTVKKDTTAKAACAVDTTKKTAAVKPEGAKPLELTLEQLAKFNGQNGQPAYVAVDGVIYDVTNAKAWSGGSHKGYKAGSDVTKLIKKESPHGLSVLKNDPVVGKLIASPAAAPVK